VGSGSRGVASGASLPGLAVDLFADDVGVPGVLKVMPVDRELEDGDRFPDFDTWDRMCKLLG